MPFASVSVLAVAGDLDRVARVELALHRHDPHREQARAALAQRPRGALVDHERAVRGLRVLQPQLERAVAASLAPRTSSPRAGRRAPLRAPRRAGRCRSPSLTPAAVAMSAATTFERIPPEPSAESRVADLQLLEGIEVARPPRSASRSDRGAGRRCRGRRCPSTAPADRRPRASPPAPPGSRCRRRRSRRSRSCRSR